MTIQTEPVREALVRAGLTAGEADLLHSDIRRLLARLEYHHLLGTLPATAKDGLISLAEACQQLLQELVDSPVNGHPDPSRPCPVCGSVRIAHLVAQDNRACCKECGLPCDLYDRFFDDNTEDARGRAPAKTS